MNIPKRLRMPMWLATVVLSVAFISHVFDQPQDLTLAVILVAVCLLAFDWFITPHN